MSASYGPEVLEYEGVQGVLNASYFIHCASARSHDNHPKLRSLPLARGITAALCSVPCLVVLLQMCYRRKWKTYHQRAFLYLTISSCLYLLTMVLQTEHHFTYRMDKKWQEKLCATIGYLNQVTGSVLLLFTFAVVFNLYHTFYCFMRRRGLQQTHQMKRIEVVLLSLVMIVGVTDTLPWLLTPYGEYGPWCWIRSASNCSLIEGAFWEQMGMRHIPLAILVLFSLELVIFMLVCYATISAGVRNRVNIRNPTIIYITALLIYSILSAVEFSCAVLVGQQRYLYKYEIWMTYAIVVPIATITIPCVYFDKVVCWKPRGGNTLHFFTVSHWPTTTPRARNEHRATPPAVTPPQRSVSTEGTLTYYSTNSYVTVSDN